MAHRERSNFFGLFGCDSGRSNNGNMQQAATDRKGQSGAEEVEEGEIVEPSAPLDSLLADYEEEVRHKLALAERKKCFICELNVPKYTCPKCGVKTCSLNCCLLHKKDLHCDGLRDRLSFVPLKSFSHNNLASDCEFLDETSQAINHSSRFLHNNSTKDVSNWTHRFIQEAFKRQIRYKKMPALFKKAKENRSLFIYKEKSILWDIEFILPYCSRTNEPMRDIYVSKTVKKNRISENTILGDIVEHVTNDQNVLLAANEPNQENAAQLDTTAYMQAGKEELVALFKHDSGRLFYILDSSKSLLHNFRHQTIVEYPTIVVILRTFLKDYPVENVPTNK